MLLLPAFLPLLHETNSNISSQSQMKAATPAGSTSSNRGNTAAAATSGLSTATAAGTNKQQNVNSAAQISKTMSGAPNPTQNAWVRPPLLVNSASNNSSTTTAAANNSSNNSSNVNKSTISAASSPAAAIKEEPVIPSPSTSQLNNSAPAASQTNQSDNKARPQTTTAPQTSQHNSPVKINNNNVPSPATTVQKAATPKEQAQKSDLTPTKSSGNIVSVSSETTTELVEKSGTSVPSISTDKQAPTKQKQDESSDGGSAQADKSSKTATGGENEIVKNSKLNVKAQEFRPSGLFFTAQTQEAVVGPQVDSVTAAEEDQQHIFYPVPPVPVLPQSNMAMHVPSSVDDSSANAAAVQNMLAAQNIQSTFVQPFSHYPVGVFPSVGGIQYQQPPHLITSTAMFHSPQVPFQNMPVSSAQNAASQPPLAGVPAMGPRHLSLQFPQGAAASNLVQFPPPTVMSHNPQTGPLNVTSSPTYQPKSNRPRGVPPFRPNSHVNNQYFHANNNQISNVNQAAAAAALAASQQIQSSNAQLSYHPAVFAPASNNSTNNTVLANATSAMMSNAQPGSTFPYPQGQFLAAAAAQGMYGANSAAGGNLLSFTQQGATSMASSVAAANGGQNGGAAAAVAAAQLQQQQQQPPNPPQLNSNYFTPHHHHHPNGVNANASMYPQHIYTPQGVRMALPHGASVDGNGGGPQPMFMTHPIAATGPGGVNGNPNNGGVSGGPMYNSQQQQQQQQSHQAHAIASHQSHANLVAAQAAAAALVGQQQQQSNSGSHIPGGAMGVGGAASVASGTPNNNNSVCYQQTQQDYASSYPPLPSAVASNSNPNPLSPTPRPTSSTASKTDNRSSPYPPLLQHQHPVSSSTSSNPHHSYNNSYNEEQRSLQQQQQQQTHNSRKSSSKSESNNASCSSPDYSTTCTPQPPSSSSGPPPLMSQAPLNNYHQYLPTVHHRQQYNEGNTYMSTSMGGVAATGGGFGLVSSHPMSMPPPHMLMAPISPNSSFNTELGGVNNGHMVGSGGGSHQQVNTTGASINGGQIMCQQPLMGGSASGPQQQHTYTVTSNATGGPTAAGLQSSQAHLMQNAQQVYNNNRGNGPVVSHVVPGGAPPVGMGGPGGAPHLQQTGASPAVFYLANPAAMATLAAAHQQMQAQAAVAAQFQQQQQQQYHHQQRNSFSGPTSSASSSDYHRANSQDMSSTGSGGNNK